MKHLKPINEFKKSDETFVDWLSVKFGKKIGRLVDFGRRGKVFEFGDSNVIKLSTTDEHEALSVIDKHIPGIAKVFGRGKVIIPKRFRITFDNKPYVHYIIMEKLTITKELEVGLFEIKKAIDSFVDNKAQQEVKGYTSVGHNGLAELFNNVRNDEFIQKCFNYIVNDFDIDEGLFSELVIVFKNVHKYFNWKDIHEGQLGRNSKGELVAFDLDNPHTKNIKHSVKHVIREGIKLFEDYNVDEILNDFNKQELVSYNGHLFHGTPIGKLKSILNNGIEVNEHREMRFESISLSNNDSMIGHFGNNNGLIFDVDFKKLLKLDDFYYELLSFESGMDTFEHRGDKESIKKADRLGLKSRFGGYGIDRQRDFIEEYYTNNIRFEGSEGIVVPGFDNEHHNAEAEIVVTHEGLDKLWSSLEGVYIDGDYYDINDKEAINKALEDVEEKGSWDGYE